MRIGPIQSRTYPRTPRRSARRRSADRPARDTRAIGADSTPSHLVVADASGVEMIQLTPVRPRRAPARDGIEMPVDRVAERDISVSQQIEPAATERPRRAPGPCRRRGTLARTRRPSPRKIAPSFPREAFRAAFPRRSTRHPRAGASMIVVNDGGSASRSRSLCMGPVTRAPRESLEPSRQLFAVRVRPAHRHPILVSRWSFMLHPFIRIDARPCSRTRGHVYWRTSSLACRAIACATPGSSKSAITASPSPQDHHAESARRSHRPVTIDPMSPVPVETTGSPDAKASRMESADCRRRTIEKDVGLVVEARMSAGSTRPTNVCLRRPRDRASASRREDSLPIPAIVSVAFGSGP
jgi:hypothetical protein